MNAKKVSIIVPCYNSEKTIARLFTSLESQSYKNIEIIFVDNNSKDNSLKIIRSFAQKDRRVKVVLQPKKGASAARNAGLRNVTGEFFVFVDSDDYLFDDAIEKLVDAIDGADMAYAGIRRIYPSKKTKSQNITKPYANRLMLLGGILYQDKKTLAYNPRNPTAKIFRTKYIKNNRIVFNEGIETFEDALFNAAILEKDDVRLAFSEEIIYNYVINNGSLVQRKIKGLEKQDEIKLYILSQGLNELKNKKELISLLSLELFIDYIRKECDISIKKIHYEATEGVYSSYLRGVNIFKLSNKKKVLYLMARFHMYKTLTKIIRGEKVC